MAPKTTTTDRTTTQAPPREAPNGNLPATQGAEPPRKKHLIVQFREYVEARMSTLEEALPPHITPKKFVSVVMTALQTKPELLTCTFPSLWNACVRAAHDGLLPDGREGAIAPFGLNEEGKRKAEIATWMPMIEGLRKKIYETGKVNSWVVNVVYDKDAFDYQLGDEAFLIHKPYFGKETSGGIVGAYSIAKLTNGEVLREVMSAYQIQLVQNKSSAKNGPWSDAQAFPEMCKKTVGRRHYKQLPHSESLDAIFARDDAENGFADPEATPIAPPPQRRLLSPREQMDAYVNLSDGETIDQQTGEITETGRRGASQEIASQDRVVVEGKVVKDRDTGEVNGSKSETKPSDTKIDPASGLATNAAGAGGSPAAQTSGAEASPGAAGGAGVSSEKSSTSASTSTTTTAGQSDMPEDDDLDDGLAGGSDRPWPPGEEPTDLPEYERYLATKLASFKYADDVAPWWNSQEEKALRTKCGISVDEVRTKLQPTAIARRTALPSRPKAE